jgi:hypothetical protein
LAATILVVDALQSGHNVGRLCKLSRDVHVVSHGGPQFDLPNIRPNSSRCITR